MAKMKLKDYKALSNIKNRWQFFCWAIKTKEVIYVLAFILLLIVLFLASVITLQILGFDFSILRTK